jgi:Zn-dependent M32 family carboxypeptidase
MNKEKAIEALRTIDKELVLLSHINGVLEWDQESTSDQGKQERALQIGLIDRNVHEKATSNELEDILKKIDTSNLTYNQDFYLYKDKENKEFKLLT